MRQEQSNILSNRAKDLLPTLDNEKSRKAYLESHIRMFLANQIRAMRGDESQEEFGDEIHKPQSVVCRLENIETAKSIPSLLEIANAKGVALLVKFVDFATYLQLTNEFSDETLAPKSYDSKDIESLIRPSTMQILSIPARETVELVLHQNGATIRNPANDDIRVFHTAWKTAQTFQVRENRQ